jgi:hypothetical protein
MICLGHNSLILAFFFLSSWHKDSFFSNLGWHISISISISISIYIYIYIHTGTELENFMRGG